MAPRSLLRAGGALLAALALGLAGSAASAVPTSPTPDRGPVSGGTAVVVPAPGLTFTTTSDAALASLALGSDGVTYAWGGNSQGQLGDGTTTDRSRPTAVLAPVPFVEISASYNFSAAIGADGLVYAWGSGGRGQIGNGASANVSVPTRVLTPAGLTFSQLSSGEYYSLVLGSDGHAYVWGRAPGAFADSNLPSQVPLPAGVTFTRVSAGSGHALAIGSDGVTYAWGSNSFGQLGSPSPALFTSVPVPVASPAGVTFTDVVAGSYASYASGSDGRIYAWGMNDQGQLGTGTTSAGASPVPTPVVSPDGVTLSGLSAGFSHVVAHGSDGRTYAWGANTQWQLGNGAVGTRSLVPTPVSVPEGLALTHVSAGDARSSALDEAGRIFTWGAITGSNAPVLFAPQVVVTAVLFDGLPGTELTDLGDGTVSVVTPEHAAGPVDVVVQWTLDGVVQEDVTHVDGFTYVAAPTVTDPGDRSVAAGQGESATFSVEVTGASSIVWEVSFDDGESWQTIDADPLAVVGDEGLSLTVTTPGVEHDGHRYRVTVVGEGGSATSAAGVLTVTEVEPTDPEPTDPGATEPSTTDPTDPATSSAAPTTAGSGGPSTASPTAPGGSLASTGASLPLAALVVALLGGGVLLTARRLLAARR